MKQKIKSSVTINTVIIILFSILFFPKESLASNFSDFQDKIDEIKNDIAENQIISDDNSESKQEQLLEIEQALEDYDPSEYDEREFSKIDSTKEVGERSLQSLSGELILNNGFESGHTSWAEYTYIIDDDVYPSTDIITNNPEISANGDWYALILADYDFTDILESNVFTLPANSTSLNLDYNGAFMKSGTCVTGANAVFVGVYDVTAEEYIETEILNYANLEPSDEQYYNYIFTITPDYLSTRAGHVLEIDFMSLIEDPSCQLGLFLDDVSLTATTMTTTSVYRFYSPSNKSHFFTISATEKNRIIATYPETEWRYEGVAYYVPTTSSGNQPVYRFYSPSNKSHFFTISATEKNRIISTYPETEWRYEGTSYYVPTTSSGNQPVYRFYSPSNKSHFFTISATEKNRIIATYPETEWRYEGIAYYVPTN